MHGCTASELATLGGHLETARTLAIKREEVHGRRVMKGEGSAENVHQGETKVLGDSKRATKDKPELEAEVVTAAEDTPKEQQRSTVELERDAAEIGEEVDLFDTY